MQLIKALFITVICFNSALACAVEKKSKITSKKISNNQTQIQVDLSTGNKITKIIYKKQNVNNKWVLQIKNPANKSSNTLSELTEKEYDELISLLFFYIESINGDLDRVQVGLSVPRTLWEETAIYLRNKKIPSDYRLTPKDTFLTNTIKESLATTEIIKMVCQKALSIQKKCSSEPIAMNPITFDENNINGSWSTVQNLPDLGMPLDRLWYEIRLNQK